jgi:uncharacterized protein YbjT (DUF2867 family)
MNPRREAEGMIVSSTRCRFLLTAVLLLIAMPAFSQAPDLAPANGPALVLVAGATGQTGRQVLEQARKAGYRVRGMSRDVVRARQTVSGNYDWVSADVRDPATLGPAMAGVTYVICTIGATERSGPNSPEFVDYGGVRNLADAARAAGVRQFVLISSVGVAGGGGAFGWILNNIAMPGILDWKAKGEEHLRGTGVPYTIVRPGGLTNDAGAQHGLRFTQGDTLGGGTIPRADVAALTVVALGYAEALNKTFEVASDAKAPPGTAAWRARLAELKRD